MNMKWNFFNFKPLNGQILLTNDFGDYLFVETQEFKQLILKKIDPDSELWKKLIDKKMIYGTPDLEFSTRNRHELREVKNHLNKSTSLHIFVVTTACNMSCVYCQANNGVFCSDIFMDADTAKKAVDIALESPTRYLSFEFQGGEPLLNFKTICTIVEYAEQKKQNHVITYNLVSNLTLLTDEMLDFFVKYKFGISTSVDGAQLIHDKNRMMKNGSGTYQIVADAIQRVRDRGLYVGAIETTTKESLKYPKEIVKAYVDLGMESIFVRPLTPLGKATVNWEDIGYSPEEFLSFYNEIMETLFQINRTGRFIKESHSAILLNRINGRFVNYMELRSPCGAGIGQLAYYADGNIFTCDEGRMLYEMGEDAFCLGNVIEHTYSDLIDNGKCKAICASSILETIPTCCDCVYQPYCGVCPVVTFASNRDIIEKQPRGYRCKIYSGILDYLFTKLSEDDKDIIGILNSWSN